MPPTLAGEEDAGRGGAGSSAAVWVAKRCCSASLPSLAASFCSRSAPRICEHGSRPSSPLMRASGRLPRGLAWASRKPHHETRLGRATAEINQCRVDGVEVDAAIQDERISTQAATIRSGGYYPDYRRRGFEASGFVADSLNHGLGSLAGARLRRQRVARSAKRERRSATWSGRDPGARAAALLRRNDCKRVRADEDRPNKLKIVTRF